MTDGPALLAAILADPGDDVARLVMADWLEENGQRERAEFIRVQCELARIGCPSCVPGKNGTVTDYACECQERAEPLRRRERELLDANAHIWLFDLPPGMRPILPDAIRGTYSRGFVSRVSCSWPDWSRHAAAILERQPVERVTLTTRPSGEENDPERREYGLFRIAGEEVQIPETEVGNGLMPLLKARWPGIIFELPDTQLVPPYVPLTADDP